MYSERKNQFCYTQETPPADHIQDQQTLMNFWGRLMSWNQEAMCCLDGPDAQLVLSDRCMGMGEGRSG